MATIVKIKQGRKLLKELQEAARTLQKHDHSVDGIDLSLIEFYDYAIKKGLDVEESIKKDIEKCNRVIEKIKEDNCQTCREENEGLCPKVEFELALFKKHMEASLGFEVKTINGHTVEGFETQFENEDIEKVATEFLGMFFNIN